jgi:hypothetical protein
MCLVKYNDCLSGVGPLKYIQHYNRRSARNRSQLGHHLALIKLEEAILIRSNLVDIDMIVARFGERFNCLNMALGLRAADNLLPDILFTHHLDCLLKKRRAGQLLR